MRWAACAAGVGLALVPMTGSAQAQEELEEVQEARRTLLMAMPGTPVSSIWGLVGQLGIGVEHAVGSYVALVGSVQVSGALQGTESLLPGGSGSSGQTWGVGVDPGVHFYLTGRAPEGLWVGPHLELATYHWTVQNEYLMGRPDVPLSEGDLVTVETRSRTVQYGGSVRVGYTAILAPGLTFQVGAGLTALSSRNTNFGTPRVEGGGAATDVEGQQLLGSGFGPNNIRNWSVSPRMTLGVGWAF
ncbi:hypothetical protein [Archangium lansingense]|uniref:Outer membrane protein beta-barrel domain-containing protein n=1 Tax=Archangium lansingense TaxID=2995310 RepID=A0ABT3ZUS5_9BACT|nr:hypothetical protein [Archangium lansinium]MCY1073061.1 hypothetical protein [Archangium lansinium]